jgi:hypothetical protein
VAYYKGIISAFAWWGWTSVAVFLLKANGEACNVLALPLEYTVAVSALGKKKNNGLFVLSLSLGYNCHLINLIILVGSCRSNLQVPFIVWNPLLLFSHYSYLIYFRHPRWNYFLRWRLNHFVNMWYISRRAR